MGGEASEEDHVTEERVLTAVDRPSGGSNVHSEWFRRNRGSASYRSIDERYKIPRIELEDNDDPDSPRDDVDGSNLWAKRVTVDDYTVVEGNSAGGGSYVVWICTVNTLDGGPMVIRKRYSEFDQLRQRLLKTFPRSAAAMPQLPPKSFISKFRPQFLQKRKAGLSYFLNCVLLNPEFAGSPVLKDFLFS